MSGLKGFFLVILAVSSIFIAFTGSNIKSFEIKSTIDVLDESKSIDNSFDGDNNLIRGNTVFKPSQEETLLINEFRTDTDWIELYNPTSSSISLNSYTIVSIADSTALSGAIGAGSFYGTTLDILDEGDNVTLLNDDQVIDAVSYGVKGGAPQPVGSASVARVNTIGNNGAIDWNLDLTPTILAENDAVDANLGSSSVYFTEVYVNSTDGFIELKNHGSTAINISDWKIVVDAIYTIPAESEISGSSTFILDVVDYPVGMDITTDADNLYLYDSNWERIDQIGWNNATTDFGDYSWNRLEGTAYNPRIFDGYSNITCKLVPCTPTRGIDNIEIVVPSTSNYVCSFYPAKITITEPVVLNLEFQVRGGQNGITKVFGLGWLFRFDDWFEIKNKDSPTAKYNHTHPGEEILFVGDSKPLNYFDNLTSNHGQYEKYRASWTFEINASEVIRIGLTKAHKYDVFAEFYIGGVFLANETGNFMTLDFVTPNLRVTGPNPQIQYPYDRPMVLGTLAAVRLVLMDEGQDRDFYIRVINDEDADSDGTLLIENLTVALDISEEMSENFELTKGVLTQFYGNLDINEEIYFNFSLRGIAAGEGTFYIRFLSDNDFLKRANPKLMVDIEIFPTWNPFHWHNPIAPVFWIIFVSIPVVLLGGRYLISRSRKRKESFLEE